MKIFSICTGEIFPEKYEWGKEFNNKVALMGKRFKHEGKNNNR